VSYARAATFKGKSGNSPPLSPVSVQMVCLAVCGLRSFQGLARLSVLDFICLPSTLRFRRRLGNVLREDGMIHLLDRGTTGGTNSGDAIIGPNLLSSCELPSSGTSGTTIPIFLLNPDIQGYYAFRGGTAELLCQMCHRV
jgi:hypothetical protein